MTFIMLLYIYVWNKAGLAGTYAVVECMLEN